MYTVLVLTCHHGILGIIRLWGSKQGLDTQQDSPNKSKQVVTNRIGLSSTYLRVMAAAHWSLSMSKQIAPVTLETFGCHILVINLTCKNMRS